MYWSKLVELYTEKDGFYFPFFLMLSKIKIIGKNPMWVRHKIYWWATNIVFGLWNNWENEVCEKT